MITSLKYLPLLIASIVSVSSLTFKLLFSELKLTYLFRDIILFFILYYVLWMLSSIVERILKNYWKIL